MKIEVSTHSGDTDVIEVDEFDVMEITKMRNGDDEAIAIGNHSYSRIDIKNIKPIEKTENKE